MPAIAPDEDRRYQPDRRKLDEDTISFRTSVYGRLEAMTGELHSGEERFASIDSQIAELRDTVTELRTELKANSGVTKSTAESLDALSGVVNKIKESLDSVAEFMNAMTGGMKALEGIARVARAVGAIAMAAGAVLAIFWAWPKK